MSSDFHEQVVGRLRPVELAEAGALEADGLVPVSLPGDLVHGAASSLMAMRKAAPAAATAWLAAPRALLCRLIASACPPVQCGQIQMQRCGGGPVSARVLPLLLHDNSGLTRRNVTVDHLVVAGWTGRDRPRSRSTSRNSTRSASSGRRRRRSSIAPRRRGSPSTTASRCSARHRAARSSSCCCSRTAGCGSAPAPTIPTARWRNTASRSPSRCATSRSRRNSGRWSRSRRIGTS